MLSCAGGRASSGGKLEGLGGKEQGHWILKPLISNGAVSFQGNKYAFSDIEGRSARTEGRVTVVLRVAGRSKRQAVKYSRNTVIHRVQLHPPFFFQSNPSLKPTNCRLGTTAPLSPPPSLSLICEFPDGSLCLAHSSLLRRCHGQTPPP